VRAAGNAASAFANGGGARQGPGRQPQAGAVQPRQRIRRNAERRRNRRQARRVQALVRDARGVRARGSRGKAGARRQAAMLSKRPRILRQNRASPIRYAQDLRCDRQALERKPEVQTRSIRESRQATARQVSARIRSARARRQNGTAN